MRLVAVSIVKNEADIIEPFVRHTLAWMDHHLVFDHDSTDGTREILRALKAEGLAITLFTDHALENLQQARSNHLTRQAVSEFGADWVLPLDADEILAGPGRADLEKILGSLSPDQPASLPLFNYYPTTADETTVANPVLRLRYCQPSPPRTRKLLHPAPLAGNPAFVAGKGNHVLFHDGKPVAEQLLPDDFYLAHLALRSPQHQVLRVVLAELQKTSRGQAHAGLDLHYRLGFQLLAENPALFFATIHQAPTALRLQPIAYHGGALRHPAPLADWSRVARALLPYLEKLAASHGRLVDAAGPAAADASTESSIHELVSDSAASFRIADSTGAFAGFTPISGWGHREGPVPEAFLPPFHWSFAPVTELIVKASHAGAASMVAEGLTYSESQEVTVKLNDETVLHLVFSRTNQKESLIAPLALRSGDNRLSFHYTRRLTTDFDPRPLAMIFLSLQIRGDVVS